MTTLGSRLARLRNKHDLTQTQLAEILNTGKSTIAMYEKDKRQPGLDVLMSISSYFNVSVDYLLRGIEQQPDIIMEDSDGNVHIIEVKHHTHKEKEVNEELKKFIERYNKLDEDEQVFLMKKIDKLTKTLEEM